jgi:hypothetical protein
VKVLETLFWLVGRRKGLPKMAETKKTIKLLGFDIKVVDVPVKSANEPFAEYELEDGSKVRVKFAASSFLRIENEYGPDGKPVYLVFSAPAINVLSSPDGLLRPPEKTN